VKKKNRKNKKSKGTVYRPLPSNMKVKIRGRTYETATSSASPLYFRYGLVEFLNRGGNYTDSLYGLYKFGKVHHSKITVRLVNVTSEPLVCAVAPLPFDWVGSTPTLGEILDVPKCMRKTTGGATGQDKIVISNSASVKDMVGSEFGTILYQMTQAQATSSTPINNSEPCWIVAVSAFNGLASISFRLEIEFEWDVDFYALDSS